MQYLRDLGYTIEAQPHLGYRLASIPDKMFADEIAHSLKTKFVGRKIFSYDTLDSTNDAAFRLGEQGIEEGASVFAEYQKKGRGRLGRDWVSPKGKNLILSVLLRPLLSPTEASKITLAAAVSVIQTVRKTIGKTLGIKWPNDIVCGHKKVGGILTEMSAEVDRVNFVVVGIGLNINSVAKELPKRSISLKEIAGHEVSRVSFARDLLEQLEKDLLLLKKGHFEMLAKEWEDFSVISGRRVAARVLGRKIEGEAMGIDKDGALWIRKDDGLQERITAGDVEYLWK
jgi:BirA family biotin operon repressor/biotin-[acetyl-CoA-carboxylase] ligase